ncbi:MAG: hypothetical protein LBM93_01915, partial [Oscillospiraceae bacterium]|nr:hypothetical protein [Oscillospiraceae bacterium]
GVNLKTGYIYPLFWKKNGEKVSKDDFMYLGEWHKKEHKFNLYSVGNGRNKAELIGVSEGKKYVFTLLKELQVEFNGESLRFGGVFACADEGLVTEIHKNSVLEVQYKRNFNDIVADIECGKTVLEQEVEVFIRYGKGKKKNIVNIKNIDCIVSNYIYSGYCKRAVDKFMLKKDEDENNPYKLSVLNDTSTLVYWGYEITDTAFNFIRSGYYSFVSRIDKATSVYTSPNYDGSLTDCLQGDWVFSAKSYADWQEYRTDTADVLSAKRAILGQGNLKMSADGDLFEVEADRNGRLKIPEKCKIIQSFSLFPSGDKCVVEVGENVEIVHRDAFDYKRDWGKYGNSLRDKKIFFNFNNTKFNAARVLIEQAADKLGWNHVFIEDISGDYCEVIAVGVRLNKIRYFSRKGCVFANFSLDNLIKSEDVPRIEEIFKRERGNRVAPKADKSLALFKEWAELKFGK